jgi:hypothetical protein
MTASGLVGSADALGDAAVVGATDGADADGDGAPVLVQAAKANIATSATLNVLLVLTVALLLWMWVAAGSTCPGLAARRVRPRLLVRPPPRATLVPGRR